MQCDVIMAVWNQLTFTRDCIESIFKNTDGSYRLIIIDNASGEETKKYLEELARENPSVLLVRNNENTGFVKAMNQGMSLSKAPYICLLNNDTLVMKGWLKTMIDIAEAHKDIGILNPSSNNLGQKPQPGEPIEYFAANLAKDRDEFIELGAAIGFCMLIKREVIERIGMFDEIYGMGNFEDTDFSRRAIKEGYRCARACGAYVYHRENTSFKALKTFDEDFRRNREIFECRWGKPKRVAYLLDSYDSNTMKRIEMDSLKLARQGNWVWYFLKKSLEVPNHSNIISIKVGEEWYLPKAVFGILKKKKKFSEILVGDERTAGILKWLDFIHKAKVGYY